MAISVSRDGDVTVIQVSGKMRVGEGGVNVWETVLKALDEGSLKIVLNLAGVIALDSGGVGELVSAHTSAQRRGAKLKVAALSPKVAEVLQITQLLGVLDTYRNEEEALIAFAG